MQTVELAVRPVQRQSVGQRGLFRGGGVCPMCRLSDGEKKRGAQHSEYERTQSATLGETAGMQRLRAAYMFKEAAAEWRATDEVRKLKRKQAVMSSVS